MNIQLTTAEKIFILRKRTGIKQGNFGLKALNVSGSKELSYDQAVRKQAKIEAGFYTPTDEELEKIAETFQELGITTQSYDLKDDAEQKQKVEKSQGMSKYLYLLDVYPFIKDFAEGLHFAHKSESKALIKNVWQVIRKAITKQTDLEHLSAKAITSPDNPINILLVDDDKDYIESLSDMLKDEYNVIKCNSGKSAIELMNSKIHIVILDIKMAGLDGLKVADRLIEKNKDIFLIFNTAYPGEYEQSTIDKKYRPFGYVTKDDCDSLLRKIDEAKPQLMS